MVWIRSKKNGNAFDVTDVDHARQLVAEGHEAFETDPRAKEKAKAWVDPQDDGADSDND